MDSHRYLGSAIIAMMEEKQKKIIKRIYQVKIAFDNKKTIFTSRNISLKIRKKSI